MKSFEKTVRRRLRAVACFAAVFCAAVATVLVLKIAGVAGLTSLISFEVLGGLLAGSAAASFYRIRKYRTALKSPEALEELHIRETDERNRVVGLKACRATINAAIGLLGLAGLVLSFFDRTALLTVSVVLMGLLALYAAFSLYYARQ